MSMGETLGARLEGLGLPARLGRSDHALARRAAAGDDAAFAAIFERYHQDLYRYCLSVLRDPDDAQDALQNTIAAALRSLPGERREIQLRPWLFRVAHNNAISLLRSRRPTADAEMLDHVTGVDGEQRVQQRDRLRGLLTDLEALSEHQRAALVMRELSDLSYEQIGEALSISAQAARQSLYEARMALRDLEEGREMECDPVCELIAAGDRRALRGRRVRAHLRACESCSSFRESIDRRQGDLAALFPPLAPVAAATLLQAALGSGAAAGAGAVASGATGGAVAAGHGFGATLAAKSVASVVAATAIGVGAADYSGLVDVPVVGSDRDRAAVQSSSGNHGVRAEPAAPQSTPSHAQAPSARTGGPGAPARETRGARDGADGPKPTHAGGPQAPAPGPTAPAGQGNPAAGGATPAPTNSNPAAAGPPAHSNAGGQPPAHSNAGGAAVTQPPPAPPLAAPAQAPEHSSAGGSPTAVSQGGGRPAAPGKPVGE